MIYAFGIVFLVIVLAICSYPVYLSYRQDGGNKGKELFRKATPWRDETGPVFVVTVTDRGFDVVTEMRLALSKDKKPLPYVITHASHQMREYAQALAAQWNAEIFVGQE